MGIGRAFSDMASGFIAALVMLVLAIVAFFITVFVVSTGAGLAGYEPSGNFVVLSATILVAAAIMSGMKA